MFVILRSKISVAALALGAVLWVFSTSGDVSAQENFRIEVKATEDGIGTGASLLLPAQASKEDNPTQKKSLSGWNAMDDVKYTFIEMNCQYLRDFQEKIRIEFIKNFSMAENKQELSTSLVKYNPDDIKEFLRCFEAVEEGKEKDPSSGEELEFISVKTPFLYASEAKNPSLWIKVYLQIYITFSNNKPHTASIMANF
jgi:hypothetical protein